MMIQQLEALAEMRGTLKHLAMALQAIRPRVTQMENGLGAMVEEFGWHIDFHERPPVMMPVQPKKIRYYRASLTATEKARCAVVATEADMAALLETLEATIDRLNVAAYVIAAENTSADEGTDDAAV